LEKRGHYYRGATAEEFKRIRSDIFIPVVVIPECVNLKPSSWNPACGLSQNKRSLAVSNRHARALFPF
jgi:hypothetical protein